MKRLLVLLSFLAFTSVCSATTRDELAKLAQLKTSDDFMIQLLQKSPLEKPLTSEDVVFLKEHGVSEQVINYLWSQNSQDIGNNLRVYETTNKKGKTIQVVTNLDENGKRIGPPAPPPMEPIAYPEPEPPKEIHVVVENVAPPAPEEPEYQPQDYPYGIPLDYVSGNYGYGYGYGYGNGFYPGYPGYPCMHRNCGGGNGHRQGPGRGVDVRYRPPQIPPRTPYVSKPVHGSSAGAMRRPT